MIAEQLSVIGLTRDTIGMLIQPPRVRTFDYCCDFVPNHKGEPFNPIDFPWTEYICDTWDDIDVRSVTLQFAARLGKTQLAMSLMVAAVANDPSTFMYGCSSETIVKDTVREKWYPMFRNCVHTRRWVPPSSRQIQTRINLATCQGYTAWSGSPTQLSDKDPKYLHAGEVDKWDKSRSDEADSLPLFLQRGAEIPDRKVIIESTPQITNRSRVNYHLLNGWNCRYLVPCPKCSKRQQVVFGDGKEPGGFLFDKRDGKLHAETARLTARYQCKFCRYEIDEDRRRPMVRKGVWCPEGQTVTKTGRVRGTMTNPGPNASFQLARFYAPTFSFGDCAAAFVSDYLRGDLRDFDNSVKGETWQPVLSDEPWDKVAERMGLQYQMRTVPVGGYFLTCAVDVQIDHFVFAVIAWGKGQRGWLVDYGALPSWVAVKQKIRECWVHEDGGPDIGISLTLIDAKDGNRMDEVIDFSRSVNSDDGPWVWPCMGAKSGAMGMVPYKRNILDKSNRRGSAVRRRESTAFCTVTVNTNLWQQWMHNCLYHREPGQDRSLALPEECREDEDLFTQLMNELPDTKQDATNHDSFVWVKVFENVPVDLRDTFRYNRCAAEVYTRTNWSRVGAARKIPKSRPKKKEPIALEPRGKGQRPAGKETQRRWIRKLSHRHFGGNRSDGRSR